MASPASGSPLASVTSIVLPTVPEIFGNGTPFSQLQPGQIYQPGGIFDPNLYLNETFQGLYYKFSFLWPQIAATGIVKGKECTPDTCSLLLGFFLYLPNVPANIFFAVFFGVLLLANVVLSIRGRTWGFLAGMTGGLVLEILGYVGRVLVHHNDFSTQPFYLYIIGLTIGPAFISASIYLCLGHIVVVFGRRLSRFKPLTYTYTFVGFDFFSLVLQAIGGGIAASNNFGSHMAQVGIDIMIAGLAFQVFSLSAFIVLCSEYAVRVLRRRSEMDPERAGLRASVRFRGFMGALVLATLTIYARSVFRVAELQQGFHSEFANNEVTFMVLETTMISVAVLALTAFHPALVFGALWQENSKKMRAKNPDEPKEDVPTPPDVTPDAANDTGVKA